MVDKRTGKPKWGMNMELAENRLRWYAVRVRTRFEKIVENHLCDRGFEAFLPSFKVRRRWSDRIKTIEKPLFPGYLFCRTDLRSRLPIMTVPGFVDFVGFGTGPTPIEDCELDSLRMVTEKGQQYQPWPFSQVGQAVQVINGPLRGVHGIMVEMRNERHILVSVTLLQRSVLVDIDVADIRPV
jgi:transcription antitermination factor NusG